MIAFGCLVGSDETYRQYAQPGIARCAESNSEVLELRDRDCIFTAYNEILARADRNDDLEALVLLHDDVEISEADLGVKVRRWLADPAVAVVGAAGGRGVSSIAWWRAPYLLGGMRIEVLPDPEVQGTELFLPAEWRSDYVRGGHDVDSVDGTLMVLSPWAVSELRFDESLGPGFHGYDADFCFQARDRGRRVVAEDIEMTHHTTLGVDREGWIRAHVAFARKWESRMPRQAGWDDPTPLEPSPFARAAYIESLRESRRA